ncbi:MAG: phage tail tape measure protein, partial [Eubacteriales bacterium]|nr:phage tail tape measure protein [Eubacteriales bacterium]
MGQQELRTVITIGGNVDNSFSRIGSALLGLGSMVDMVSQKVITFGKESVEEYVNYDDLMREVKAVGEFSSAEIAVLDSLNTQIAQTTTYSNTQAAQAEVLLGQLGLTTQQIQTLMPNVLNLAMDGNLDLADSVSYLYSVLKGTGTGLEDSDTLVDQMAKTASIGATDIDTLGDSMTRLGSGMQLFKGGSVEVMTLLSAMSQFGKDMQGEQAGTHLRNFALSLIAPMGQTKEVTAALDNFGMTQQELADFMADEEIDTTGARAAIQELGIDVFDSNGNLNDMLDIIPQLRTALNKLPESLRIPTLRQIFGKREYITAANLLKLSDTELKLTWDDIVDSEGFAEGMKETMQGGIGGALRELSAAYGDFQKTVGGALAPTVEAGADWLHGIVTDLSNMDEGTLDALVSGLGIIAAAGPALITAGMAFRIIGYALSGPGAIGLGLIALAGGIAALQQLKEADMAGNFGTMNLDSESLQTYVTELGDGFKSANAEIDEYSTALDNSVTAYQKASTALSGDLLTAMLTGTTLTDADKARLQGYGTEMYTQLQTGIASSAAESMTFLEMLYGGEGEAELDPNYQNMIDVTNQSYQGAMAEAEARSLALRAAMTSAFADGIVTDDEYNDIVDYIKAYNKAMADAAAGANVLVKPLTPET